MLSSVKRCTFCTRSFYQARYMAFCHLLRFDFFPHHRVADAFVLNVLSHFSSAPLLLPLPPQALPGITVLAWIHILSTPEQKGNAIPNQRVFNVCLQRSSETNGADAPTVVYPGVSVPLLQDARVIYWSLTVGNSLGIIFTVLCYSAN